MEELQEGHHKMITEDQEVTGPMAIEKDQRDLSEVDVVVETMKEDHSGKVE